MKKNRLEKVIDIINTYEIETQDQLIAFLRREGFDVTQATVSRDIRELKLVKVTTGRGSYRYTMPRDTADGMKVTLHISSALAETITKVESACNQVVLHTYPGMASAIAAEVDHLRHARIMGCIAGDDTVFILCYDNDGAVLVSNQIKEMIRNQAKNRWEEED